MSNGLENSNVRNELERLLTCFLSDNEKLEGIRPGSILIYGEQGVGKTRLVTNLLGGKELEYHVINPRYCFDDRAYMEMLNMVTEKVSETDRLIVVLDNLEVFAHEAFDESREEITKPLQKFIRKVVSNKGLVIAIVDDPLDCPKSVDEIWKFDYVIEVPQMSVKASRQISYEFWKDKLDSSVDAGAIASVFAGLKIEEQEQIYQKKCLYEVGGTQFREYNRILDAAVEVLFGIPCMLSETPNDIREGRYENAVYEAGRIVVSEIIHPGSVRISTIHRLPGTFGGNTLRYPMVNCYPTMKQDTDEVMYMLAGKAAIEVVYGGVDIKCRQDLADAVAIIADYESQLCPYDFDVYPTSNPSKTMREMLESAVSDTMKKLYLETCKIIKDNRGFLDAVANHLAYSYTITQLEISRLYIESPKKKRWLRNTGERK